MNVKLTFPNSESQILQIYMRSGSRQRISLPDKLHRVGVMVISAVVDKESSGVSISPGSQELGWCEVGLDVIEPY